MLAFLFSLSPLSQIAQSIIPIWGAQSDIEDDDVTTCVAYDTINGFGYLALYGQDISDPDDILGLYLPDAATNLTSFGDADILLLKFDGLGQLFWAITIGGAKDDNPTGICVDAAGNCYLVGGYKANITFNSLDGTNTQSFADDGGGNGTNQAFICSYTPNGTLRWAKNEGGSGDDAFHSITNTSSGVIAIGHFFENNNESLQGINVTSANDDTDLFLAKYSHTGANTWILAGGSTEADFDTSNKLEDARWDVTSFNDTLYFAGLFRGIDFNFDYSTNPSSQIATVFSTESDPDYVFGSIGPNGNLLWLRRQLHDTGNPKTVSIAAACNGVFIGGIAQSWLYWEGSNLGFKNTTGNNDMFIARYNRLTGNPETWRIIGSPNEDSEIIYDMVADRKGNILLTGTHKNSLNVGSATIPANTSGAVYILSFNGNLTFQGSAFLNSTSFADISYGICMEEDDFLFIVGTSNGDLITGQTPSNTSYDGFVANFYSAVAPTTACCGNIVFNCPSNTPTINIANNCTAATPDYIGSVNSTIPCASHFFSQTPAAGAPLSAGTHQINITQLGSVVCSFNLSVLDITKPTISTPGNQILTLGSSCTGVLGDYRNLFNASDNCTPSASLVLTQAPSPGTAVTGVGAIHVSVTATDQSGNSTIAWITVVPRPSSGPVITNCPQNISAQAGANCQAPVTFTNPTVSPACGTCFSPTTISGFTYMGIYNNNKYFRSNAATRWHTADSIAYVLGGHLVTITSQSENVFVTNNTANIKHWIGLTDEVIDGTFYWTNGETAIYSNWFTGEPNNLNGDQDFAAINHNTAGKWDDEDLADSYRYVIEFDCPTLALTTGQTSGSLFPLGTSTQTFTAVDQYGTSSTCSFNLVVSDVTAPILTCPSAQNLFLSSSCTAILDDYRPLAVATDNCTTAALNILQTPAPGTIVSGTGVTVVTLTATDVNSNIVTCNFNVNRVDNTPPSITCPGPQTLSLNSSCTALLGNYTSSALKSDNCTPTANIIVTQSPVAGTVISGTGVTPVTFTAADAAGNITTCIFDVLRVDVTPPTINCPSAQTLALNNSCAGVLGNYTTLATKSDNCTPTANIVVTQSPAAGTAVSGVGTTIVTLTATDAAGNFATCTFNVNRVDNTPPVVTCPGNQTVASTGSCAGTIGNYVPLTSATDNCSSTINITQSPAAGTAITAPTTVTMTASDTNGNSSTCTFQVTPVDNTPPTITCPGAQTLALNNSCAGVLGNYTTLATKSDNCTPTANIIVTQSPAAGTAVSGVGTTIVTLTATDAAGNFATCTFNVNRVDSTPPVVTCPGNQTVASIGSCAGTIGNYVSLTSATDNCSSTINITQSPAAGTAITAATTVTMTASDTNGNSSTCTFLVTPVDNTPPTITCPSAQTLALNNSCAGVLGNYTTLATKSDNCTPTANIIVTQSPAAGTAVSGVGTTIVTLTATDAAGNFATCTFNVNRVDNTPPTLTCLESQTLVLNDNCIAVIPDYSQQILVGTGCNATSELVITQFPIPGTLISANEQTTITITVTETSNLSATCSFLVSAIDNTRPTLVCPLETIALISISGCNVTMPSFQNELQSIDNCAATSDLFYEQSIPAGTILYMPGNYTMDITIADSFGNQQTCVINYQVPVLEGLEILCPDPIAIILNENCQSELGDYSELAQITQPCLQDENLIWEQFPEPGSILTGATTTSVALIATSTIYGSVACSFEISTEYNLSEIVTCPQGVTLYHDNECNSILPDLSEYSIPSLPCIDISSITYSQTPAANSLLANSTLVLLTVDHGSQSLTCPINVTVIDTIVPEINCPDTYIMAISDGCNSLIPDLTEFVIGQDNCTAATMLTWIQSVPAGTTILGLTPVTLTVVDASGNSSACQLQVQVIEPIQDVIYCPENIVLNYNENCEFITSNIAQEAQLIEGCSTIIEWSQTPESGTIWQGDFSSIDIVVVLSNDETLTCNVAVQLQDVAPMVVCPESISQPYTLYCENEFFSFLNQLEILNNCSTFADSNITQQPAAGTLFNDPSSTTMYFTWPVNETTSSSCQVNINYIADTEIEVQCPDTITLVMDQDCTYEMPVVEGSVFNSCGIEIEVLTQEYPAAGSIIDNNSITEIVLMSQVSSGISCTVQTVYEVEAYQFECSSDTIIPVLSPSYLMSDFRPWLTYTTCNGIEWSSWQYPGIGTELSSSTTVGITYMSSDGSMQQCNFNLTLDFVNVPVVIDCPLQIEIPMSLDCNIQDSDIFTALSSIPVITNEPYWWNFIDNGQLYNQPVQQTITVLTETDGTASCSILFIPIDTQTPTINAFVQTEVIVPNSNCEYLVPDLTAYIFADDNCSYELTQNPEAGSIITSTTVVSITADDGINTSSASIVLELQPYGLPVLNQLDNLTLGIDPILCTTEYNWLEAIYSLSGCGTALIETVDPYNTTFEVGTYTLGYYALDDQGNSSTPYFFELSIEDQTGPMITPFANDEIQLCNTDENWSIPQIIDCSNFTYEITQADLIPGDNFFTVVATDIYNNFSNYTFNVHVNKVVWPEVIIDTEYCQNSAAIELPSAGFDNTIWYLDGTAIGNTFDPALITLGLHELTLEAIIDGCPMDSTIWVDVLAQPVNPDLLAEYFICGSETTLEWNTNASLLEWTSDPNTLVLLENNSLNFEFSTFASHIITMEITNGECNSSIKTTIHNDEPIALVAAGEDQIIAIGFEAQLNGICSVNNFEWEAETSDLQFQSPGELQTMIEVPFAGNYEIWLTGFNGVCELSDTITVSFTGLEIPNTLTANGDNINDYLIIPGDQVDIMEIRIMNRWGQVVFESTNYQNNWNGQNTTGDHLPGDTYFYELKIAQFQYSGFIQIQR